ncbi:CidA/LrgA family protein [Acinetobacter larvae]|uniref:CidA/LrgA family protein n=1 Tax=Acinetobacter larvae TaxID=1789224 RepID=A0A1B2M005_9GAMM|nr:CidA/LrgA family protein [Acinetobacter larvae]AOA58522.1 CidA/LrgA family protein [Acinetobacter larvae]
MLNSPLGQSLRHSHYLKVSLQIGLLFLFWWMGCYVQAFFHLPVSGAVVGLFLVLIALLTGLIKLHWIKRGADFILAELVLFFIPCFVAVLKYKDLFLSEGWQLLVAVAIGTICVMVTTAYSVYLGFKLEQKLKAHFTPSDPDAIHHGGH